MDRSHRSPQKQMKLSQPRSASRKANSLQSRGLAWWPELKKTTLETLVAVPMLVALFAAIVGILLQNYLNLPATISLAACTLCAVVALVGDKLKLRLMYLRAASGLALVTLLAALFQLELDARPIDTLKEHATSQWKPLVVEGVVREPLRYRPQIARQITPAVIANPVIDDGSPNVEVINPSGPQWTTLLALEVNCIVNGGESCSTYGHVTVVVDGMLEQYLPGDRVRIAGRMILVGPVRNPGEPDYQEWMHRRGEWVRFRAESPDAIEKTDVSYTRFFVKRWLAYFGQVGRQQLARHLPEPQCSLAAALLLGQREQVGNETNEKLLATGTIHLLSISGLHVEMIAVSLMMLAIFCRVPRSMSLWGIGLTVLIYAMVTGSNPPVVRATVLVLGVLSGRWTGRPANVYNMLGLAGVSLLIYQPSLLFDLGTELSFLAVFCLVLLSRADAELVAQNAETKKLDASHGPEKIAEGPTRKSKVMGWLQGALWPWFKSMCSMNVGVWLATTPLVLYHFNIFSPIALLLNVLLWLPVLVAMLSGLALMLLGWVPLLGNTFGFLCHVSILSIQALVDWGYDVRGGHVWLPEPSWSWLVIAYVLVGMSMFFMLKRFRWRVVATCMMIAWIFIGSIDGWIGPAGVWGNAKDSGGLTQLKAEELRIQVLDVGHGSAVIIRLPDGTAWLYDAGRLGDQQQVYKTISQALWQLRVARLHGIILSHADSDHYSGMKGVVRRFVVDQFAAGPRQWEHSSPAIQELHQLLQNREIELLKWNQGEELVLGDVVLKVIHPPQEQMVGSDNSRSVCVILEFAGRKILLPGDLESPGMEQVATLPTPDCDVVMAPHHGSLSGDPKMFLDWCQAKWVLISGSERADSPAVHSVYGASGRDVYLTAREHALELRVSPDGGMMLSHWNEKAWEFIREIKATK
jgi:competence protein ComEC